ncbi:hypothetical protein FA13DRAFT_1638766, partial [Coprinellus micaceus]
WYPWRDRLYCTLDILMHLPRSVFSEKQIDLMLWLLKVNGITDCPSTKEVKDWSRDINRLYGIDTFEYNGALGHVYYVNSISQMLAQEFANPKVRHKLHVLPEDSGPRLSEARQGKRWLHELHSELTTPWHRSGTTDYFTFEPTLATKNRFVIPTRWFTRGDRTFAKCWDMEPVSVDGTQTWRAVVRSPETEVPADELLKSYPELKVHMADFPDLYRNIPTLFPIHHVFHQEDGTCAEWDGVNWSNEKGSYWRQKSGGRPVYSVPIWLYCDDTSGNMSKKWNKHNSWLFTLAGLPRTEVTREYNVHFLCTSNLAEPMEMLDGIQEEISRAQREGIWAWDCSKQDGCGPGPVMIFPVVLALLGDNPMQSEMACHIGLAGRKFCRVCEAENDKGQRMPLGTDIPGGVAPPVDASPSGPADDNDTDNPDPPNAIYDTGSDTSQPGSPVEGTQPRRRHDTERVLRNYITDAKVIGNEGRIEAEKTRTGVKDTFLAHFLEKIKSSYKSHRGVDAQQKALDLFWDKHFKEEEVENMINPVWRLKGLDAHQDTPVEILHVVLLGLVKYFWRDAVRHQLHKKEDKLAELAVRLDCIDVHGLGLSSLRGRTLVQYAGSLVGRDFRAVAQVAPFVLHNLISPESYETWLSLSKLIPLIWQPEIEDIVAHSALLKVEIHQFLLRTARWTGRWFNKPKFHILVHLPSHIERFGPAILFATEAFESFNAIIRAKSVHSNRAAPSRDIAEGFSQWERIRHWLSGGWFRELGVENVMNMTTWKPLPAKGWTRPVFDPDPEGWKCTGMESKKIVNDMDGPIPRYVGLVDRKRLGTSIFLRSG